MPLSVSVYLNEFLSLRSCVLTVFAVGKGKEGDGCQSLGVKEKKNIIGGETRNHKRRSD